METVWIAGALRCGVQCICLRGDDFHPLPHLAVGGATSAIGVEGGGLGYLLAREIKRPSR